MPTASPFRRRTAQVCAALALLTAAGTAAPTAASAAVLPSTAAAYTPGPVDAIAVTGGNRRLYVTTSDAGSWLDLGGQLYDAPVIVAAESDDYFIGIGGGGMPYVRSFDLGWKALGPAGTNCSGPSAAVSGSTLTVACRGGNGRLYSGTTTIRPGALPSISRFVDRGGAVLYGSITTVLENGSFEHAVVGTNQAVYRTVVDTRGVTTAGFSREPGAPRCFGSLSTDEISGAGRACRAEDATLTVSANDSVDADGLVTIAGAVVGRPGVAVDEDGTSRYYVLGTNGRIYTAGQSAAGVVSGFRAAPSGSGLYGLSAASLTEPAVAP